ncbi:CapA family protein [Baekduia soli]|uniref:CapA family protein n=1 Tax=Baekduia soli TaxID=496014 RepID=UPI00165286D4|nr:CapA family protein [Baekduia soli]
MVAACLLAAVGAVCVALAAGGRDGPEAARAELPIGRPLTIAWGGDTTLGSSHGLPPQHGWAVLAPVARVLRAADLTAVNHEGTLATGGSSKCPGGDTDTCFAFRAPPANAAALRRAGVDVVNLANNHAFDFGALGLGQTVSALRRHGVTPTGRPGEIAYRTIAGARVAFLGFAPYPWASPIADPAAIAAYVRDARRHANVVVVFVHAGAEGAGQEHTPAGPETYLGEERGDVRAFAHAAVDAGADLVLGSGPHVLRGMELYRRRLIAYSLGNLAGFHTFATGGTLSLSGILRVTVTADGAFLAGSFTSLTLDGSDIPHVDRAGQAAALVSDLARADFGAAGLVVGADGGVRLTGSDPPP